MHLQTRFYSGLTDALTNVSTDGHAAQWLLMLSFLYGIFHAVGPGHGKAVVSAYLFATGDSLKRGIALSFSASFVQALSAISIVTVAAIVFNVTAVTMTHVTDLVEIGSYSLITVLGLTLLASRIWRVIATPRGPIVSGQFFCEEIPAGCVEMPEPESRPVMASPGSIRHGVNCNCAEAVRLAGCEEATTLPGYLSAVFSVGVRPCSGALIVLVFALSQGLFAAGVLSVLAMAAGTGLTVTAIAILSVVARGLMMRSVAGNSARMAALSSALQIGAAAVFFLFGAVMTVGALEANGLF